MQIDIWQALAFIGWGILLYLIGRRDGWKRGCSETLIMFKENINATDKKPNL